MELDNPAISSESTPDKSLATFFLEDTVQVRLDEGQPMVGVIAKTWHDLDEQDIWGEIEDTIPGSKALHDDLWTFMRTGQPPRNFYYFMPSAPENLPALVHATECTLLDRAFAFGAPVKHSSSSPQSGTVIAVETHVTLRQHFVDTTDSTWTEDPVKGVPESELQFVNDWNVGDFVVYKNCWMGVVDDVREEVTIKLSNGSVVAVNNPYDLEIPVSAAEPPTGDSAPAAPPPSTAVPQPVARRGTQSVKPRTVAAGQLSPGQTVVTTKANLWKGRWIFGAYDPAIDAKGVVVDIQTESFYVNWLCQNMMIIGKFVPVERPPSQIVWDEERNSIRKFKKSTGGFQDLHGKPYAHTSPLGIGGELQLGDRVRFADLDAAVAKYQGAVRKIPRSEILGFDVNTFVVVASHTAVRVLWQDLTETIHDTKDLVPYLNVDEHEVWPGEVVIVKPDTSGVSEPKGDIGPWPTPPREGPEAVRHATAPAPVPLPDSEAKSEFMRPQQVGVVQSVNPVDRVAIVRWFVSPNVEVASGFLVPGSVTGPLQPTAEDVSLYDVVAHQALGVRRGDYVLIAPERPQTDQQEAETSTTLATTPGHGGSPGPATPQRTDGEGSQLGQLVDSVRGMVDGGLLSNLSAALGNHSHPQLHAVSRMLNQFPALLNGPHPAQSQHASQPQSPSLGRDAADAFKELPPDWLGEVVGLGLDGLVTVRLGALEMPRDIKVPIERLHIIFNEDMDFGDDEEDGEDSYFDTDDDGSSMSDDEGYAGMNEPEVIEERIIYEGGERLDNGGEEDWLTDDNGEDGDEDVEMPDLVPAIAQAPRGDEAATAPTSAGPVPRTPPPIPDNIPAPAAVSLVPGAPPRFLVLDSPIPSDHAYRSQPAVARAQAVARRIQREHKILASSLPDGIFVRTWESRLDLLRVLIVGPLNTPYELAPFVFDFHFTDAFPVHPPVGFFHSWTAGVGRVNPNLYEDGKICLSLLGTWHAEKRAEEWSASGSSVLQVLVSLMGLVLVREPWYNEAGFTVYEGVEEAALNSHLYSEKAYILARGFVKHVLQRPVQGLEKIIDWLYLPPVSGTAHQDEEGEDLGPGPFLLKEVVQKARDVVKRSESGQAVSAEETADGVGRISKGAQALLKRHLDALERILAENTK